MSFRDRMRVGTSNAEIQVLIGLQKLGLIKKMHPLGTTIVFIGGEALFYPREEVTLHLLSRAEGFTVPDFPFLNFNLPVYLDGEPIHKRARVQERDANIDKMLRSAGLNPLRLRYSPPLTKRRLQQVLNAIERELTD